MTDTATPTETPAATTPESQAGAPSLDSIKAALDKNETVAKAKEFAKQRPWAVATAVGVIGIALLNTLRGKR